MAQIWSEISALVAQFLNAINKLANHIAKTAERKPGSYPAELAQVCNLSSLSESARDAVFEATEVNEVWGVGRQLTKQLTAGGIKTVRDLAHMDPATARRGWSVLLERTVRELQGFVCITLDDCPKPKKEIAVTRSFGQPVTDLQGLTQAVTAFASRAAEKVRKQGSLASQVMVFIRTSPFRQDAQYSRSMVIPLRRPSADTALLIQSALMGLAQIYRPGFKFAKAGVLLLDLQSAAIEQTELDLEGDTDSLHGRVRLMTALDSINGRFGKGSIQVASGGHSGARKDWSMKQERRTPAYTTCISDMPVARA